MKLSVVSLLVAAVAAVHEASAAAECSEEAGMCVCSGTCPNFTSSWSTVNQSDDGKTATCLAHKGGAAVSVSNGVITVDGVTYNPPYDSCPGGAEDLRRG